MPILLVVIVIAGITIAAVPSFKQKFTGFISQFGPKADTQTTNYCTQNDLVKSLKMQIKNKSDSEESFASSAKGSDDGNEFILSLTPQNASGSQISNTCTLDQRSKFMEVINALPEKGKAFCNQWVKNPSEAVALKDYIDNVLCRNEQRGWSGYEGACACKDAINNKDSLDAGVAKFGGNNINGNSAYWYVVKYYKNSEDKDPTNIFSNLKKEISGFDQNWDDKQEFFKFISNQGVFELTKNLVFEKNGKFEITPYIQTGDPNEGTKFVQGNVAEVTIKSELSVSAKADKESIEPILDDNSNQDQATAVIAINYVDKDGKEISTKGPRTLIVGKTQLDSENKAIDDLGLEFAPSDSELNTNENGKIEFKVKAKKNAKNGTLKLKFKDKENGTESGEIIITIQAKVQLPQPKIEPISIQHSGENEAVLYKTEENAENELYPGDQIKTKISLTSEQNINNLDLVVSMPDNIFPEDGTYQDGIYDRDAKTLTWTITNIKKDVLVEKEFDLGLANSIPIEIKTIKLKAYTKQFSSEEKKYSSEVKMEIWGLIQGKFASKPKEPIANAHVTLVKKAESGEYGEYDDIEHNYQIENGENRNFQLTKEDGSFELKYNRNKDLDEKNQYRLAIYARDHKDKDKATISFNNVTEGITDTLKIVTKPIEIKSYKISKFDPGEYYKENFLNIFIGLTEFPTLIDGDRWIQTRSSFRFWWPAQQAIKIARDDMDISFVRDLDINYENDWVSESGAPADCLSGEIRIFKMFSTLLIGQDAAKEQGLWHEMGHYFMNEAVDIGELPTLSTTIAITEPPSVWYNLNHGGYLNNFTTDSIREGWAEFFSTVATEKIRGKGGVGLAVLYNYDSFNPIFTGAKFIFPEGSHVYGSAHPSTFLSYSSQPEDFVVGSLLWRLYKGIDQTFTNNNFPWLEDGNLEYSLAQNNIRFTLREIADLVMNEGKMTGSLRVLYEKLKAHNKNRGTENVRELSYIDQLYLIYGIYFDSNENVTFDLKGSKYQESTNGDVIGLSGNTRKFTYGPFSEVIQKNIWPARPWRQFPSINSDWSIKTDFKENGVNIDTTDKKVKLSFIFSEEYSFNNYEAEVPISDDGKILFNLPMYFSPYEVTATTEGSSDYFYITSEDYFGAISSNLNSNYLASKTFELKDDSVSPTIDQIQAKEKQKEEELEKNKSEEQKKLEEEQRQSETNFNNQLQEVQNNCNQDQQNFQDILKLIDPKLLDGQAGSDSPIRDQLLLPLQQQCAMQNGNLQQNFINQNQIQEQQILDQSFQNQSLMNDEMKRSLQNNRQKEQEQVSAEQRINQDFNQKNQEIGKKYNQLLEQIEADFRQKYGDNLNADQQLEYLEAIKNNENKRMEELRMAEIDLGKDKDKVETESIQMQKVLYDYLAKIGEMPGGVYQKIKNFFNPPFSPANDNFQAAKNQVEVLNQAKEPSEVREKIENIQGNNQQLMVGPGMSNDPKAQEIDKKYNESLKKIDEEMDKNIQAGKQCGSAEIDEVKKQIIDNETKRLSELSELQNKNLSKEEREKSVQNIVSGLGNFLTSMGNNIKEFFVSHFQRGGDNSPQPNNQQNQPQSFLQKLKYTFAATILLTTPALAQDNNIQLQLAIYNQDKQVITSAKAEEEIIVEGKGFAESKNIQLYFDDEFISKTSILDDGFGLKLAIPKDSKKGEHKIIILGDKAGEQAQATIKVDQNKYWDNVVVGGITIAILIFIGLLFIYFVIRRRSLKNNIM